MTELYLVRHAHAGSRSRWSGEDTLRPLSKRGRRQAEGIRDQLAHLGPKRLLSSPALRCVQTLEPLAEALGLPVDLDKRLAEGTPVAEVIDLLTEASDTPTAMCSHGDVIPAVLHAQLSGGMTTGEPLRWPKGSTWVLTWGDRRATEARYLPSPP